MDTIVNQFSSLVDNWAQVGTLASLIVLVNILVNVTKIDWLKAHIPLLSRPAVAMARPYIAVTLGAVGAFLMALQAGKSVPQAIAMGAIIGLSAIGLHETTTQLRPAVRAKMKAALKQTQAAAMLLMFITGTGLMIHAVGACATINKCQNETNPSAGCKVVNDVVDCGKSELQPAEDAAKPVLTAAVDKALGIDGSVNWDSADLMSTVEHLVMQYGECVVVDLMGQFLTAKAMPSGKMAPTPATVMDGIDRLRAKHGGHVVYHTPHGDL